MSKVTHSFNLDELVRLLAEPLAMLTLKEFDMKPEEHAIKKAQYFPYNIDGSMGSRVAGIRVMLTTAEEPPA